MLSSGRTKPFFAAIFCVATSLAFSAWLVWGPLHVMNGCDYSLIHHFFRVYLRNSFWDGEVPLWNPYTFLGRPFLADPETAVWYPPTWLWVFLPESVAYWLATGLHMALAGWGMSRLVREWGASGKASVFAGCAFVLSPPYLGHIVGGLTGFVYTISWWPLELLLLDRLCERVSLRGALKLSMVLAIAFLAGQSHAFWLCGCSLGFYVLPRCAYGSFRVAAVRVVRGYVVLALASLLALTLVGVELLPLVELTSECNRMAGREFAAAPSLGWKGFTSLFRFVDPSSTLRWEGELYMGLPILVLGLWSFCHLREARMRALALMAFASLGVAMTSLTPVFDLLYPVIPAMGWFRYNGRFAMFFVFALVIAVALLWREDGAKPSGSRVTVVLRNRIGQYAFVAFVLIWALDFGPTDWKLCRLMAKMAPESLTSSTDLTPLVKARLGAAPDAAPVRVMLPVYVLKPNSGMSNGYSNVQGYLALTPARVWNYQYQAAGFSAPNSQLTYVSECVFDKTPFPYKGANVALGWNAGTKRLELAAPEVLGSRVWLTGNVVSVPDWKTALVGISNGIDPRSCALMEYGDLAQVAGVVNAPVSGDARVIGFTRNTVTVESRADRPAVLVIAEAWFPGWHARIDDVDADVFPVNAWMRGVVVPAGAHKVEFYFRSTWLLSGAALSLAAVLTWILLWRRGGRCAQ
jgi:hypothetical protein